MLGEVLFCESDGRVLGGMQFGVLVRCCLALDGWVLWGMQFGVLVEVPRARGHAVWGAGDGQILGGMSFGAGC